jgi:hypothetical protein
VSRRLPATRRTARWLAAAALLCVGAEVAARAMGVGDFALYERNSAAGYVPQANQQGAFLGRYRWAFNDRHMGVAEPFRPDAAGVLVVGDSVVLGGNRIDQPEKLGPLLARETGCKVWPLAAPSWALANELALIEANPDFEQLGTVVIVANDSDFGAPSPWRDSLAQPLEAPWLVALHAARKIGHVPANDTAPDPAHWLGRLAALRERYSGRLVMVAYPDGIDAAAAAYDNYDMTELPALPEVEAAGGIEFIDLLDHPEWRGDLYKDDIHPSARGNRALASIIAKAVGPCRSAPLAQA